MTETEFRVLRRLSLGAMTLGQLRPAVPEATQETLMGLEEQGLVARLALAWRLTDAGWAVVG
jgi:DNA-binding HxlR family transcriptional regulator